LIRTLISHPSNQDRRSSGIRAIEVSRVDTSGADVWPCWPARRSRLSSEETAARFETVAGPLWIAGVSDRWTGRLILRPHWPPRRAMARHLFVATGLGTSILPVLSYAGRRDVDGRVHAVIALAAVAASAT
jgi:hypothetical protein